MATVEVHNQTVHYREWGSGETTLLMLHGWPADSTHYKELGPLLAKKNLRVIVPDLPGWGNTPVPPQAWTVSDYRDWVHDFIKSLGIEQFILFGHSFGGRVSIKYAIKYPYDLKGLVLCASAGIKPDHLTLKRRILKLTASLGKKAFALPGVKQLAPAARRVLYKAAGSNDYLKAEGVMKDTIVKVLEEDLSPLLNQIQMRTLLVWGTEDGATPYADAQKMHDLISKSELITFEGERHNLPKNAPEKVAKAISDYASSDLDIVK